MEKRFYWGIGLLAVFLILGLVVAFSTYSTSKPISQHLAQAAQEAISGDLEAGIALAEGAKNDWEDAWKGFASVADHSPMDEIDGLFAEMEVYAKARDGEHFGACCAQLSQLMEAMAEAHSLTWWNLL